MLGGHSFVDQVKMDVLCHIPGTYALHRPKNRVPIIYLKNIEIPFLLVQHPYLCRFISHVLVHPSTWYVVITTVASRVSRLSPVISLGLKLANPITLIINSNPL